MSLNYLYKSKEGEQNGCSASGHVSVRAVRTFEVDAVYFAMQFIIPATEVNTRKDRTTN